jgi:hypothetical protein
MLRALLVPISACGIQKKRCCSLLTKSNAFAKTGSRQTHQTIEQNGGEGGGGGRFSRPTHRDAISRILRSLASSASSSATAAAADALPPPLPLPACLHVPTKSIVFNTGVLLQLIAAKLNRGCYRAKSLGDVTLRLQQLRAKVTSMGQSRVPKQ